MRSLTSDEILAQFFFAKKISRIHSLPEIRNVVFMGMGEPADNAENVIHAVDILTTREMFQISATKVIGTCVFRESPANLRATTTHRIYLLTCSQ